MDYTALRTELHSAIDFVLNRYFAAKNLSITPGEILESYVYNWPKETEVFDSARWYEISSESDRMRMLVARKTQTDRPVWGKHRGHIAVFIQSESTRTPYPCAEFIETDDGNYAAIIPNPDNPRAALKDGEPLPDRFNSARVLRNDQVFQSIQTGPVLRLVVDSTDETTMVEHGYWVAHLRGRI